MATCPRCKGHLTEHHRCPRRPFVIAAETILWAIGGALAGLLLITLFDPHEQMSDLDPVSAVAGALVAVGVQRLVRS